MESIEALVRAAQQGDREAFERIVERFQDMAYAGAYAMIEDAQLAEDVAQEAFIEAYLNLSKLREPAAFPGWFRRIIFKQGDRQTRGKRLMFSPLEAAGDVIDAGREPVEIAEANEGSERVRRAIATLPERERVALLLFYGTGYALKDIAAFLEMPVTTVKKRLYDARQRLKEDLIDGMRDVLQEQRPSVTHQYPARVRLLIAARTGALDEVKALLAAQPMLLNMKMERVEVRQRPVLFLATGFTALHEAAENNHAGLVQLLLDYGANVNARAAAGQTPLHSAVLARCYAVAAILLAHGADADLPLANGLTALHLAAMKGDVDMVRLLLAHGAKIDSRSQHARTPLHWAALKGHTEIAQVLLASGADCSLRDITGYTPGDWADSRGHEKIVTMVQERITI